MCEDARFDAPSVGERLRVVRTVRQHRAEDMPSSLSLSPPLLLLLPLQCGELHLFLFSSRIDFIDRKAPSPLAVLSAGVVAPPSCLFYVLVQ